MRAQPEKRDQYNEITKQEKAIINKIPRLKYGGPLLLGAALDEQARYRLNLFNNDSPLLQ